jgi:hypothetical protein
MSPGIDFTKLHFGRKLFGYVLSPQILDNFPPKYNRYVYIWLRIVENNLGFKIIL